MDIAGVKIMLTARRSLWYENNVERLRENSPTRTGNIDVCVEQFAGL